VLLVEDDEINRRMAIQMLTKMGVEVQAAVDGLKALEALEQASFDLVLMDCQMPELDGYEATGAIRKREAETGAPRMPIVALTASALQGDRERCLAAGMDDYVTKPLTISQLRTTVQEWLPAPGPSTMAQGAASAAEPPPSTPRSSAPVFDRDSALERVGDDLELLQEIGKMFFDGWAERLADLERAYQDRDPETLNKVAHKTKGSALNLSAGVVSELAAELESLGKEGSLEGVEDLLAYLTMAIEDFREIFEDSVRIPEAAA
jgi:CheY-like chemotaxis protein/HPt (histidine-containing phosphotransfer) domain-containing protein